MDSLPLHICLLALTHRYYGDAFYWHINNRYSRGLQLFLAALKMAKYYVAFSRSLSTQYKAGWRSNVTVFLTLILFISFILPLILSYNTDGKW